MQVYEFKPHAGNNVCFHFYCLRLTRRRRRRRRREEEGEEEGEEEEEEEEEEFDPKSANVQCITYQI